MRKTMQLWLVLPFLVVSLILSIKAVQAKRDAEMLRMQAAAPPAVATGAGGKKGETANVTPLSDADLITARQIIEGLANKFRLPVGVKLESGTIFVEPYDGVGKEEVLADFQAVTGFFSALAHLPYQLEFSTFCVGLDCPNGFEAQVVVTGRQSGAKPPEMKKAVTSALAAGAAGLAGAAAGGGRKAGPVDASGPSRREE